MNKKEIIEKYLSKDAVVQEFGNLIIFEVSIEGIREACKDLYQQHKLQLKTITVTDENQQGKLYKIFYVFGLPKENIFLAPYIILKNKDEFPSVVDEMHEALGYTKKIKSFYGLKSIGDESLGRLIVHENWPENLFPLRKDFSWNERPKIADVPYNFQKVEGEGIYEIPVGPVHAGIIEPGHFRFSMAGEEMISLEPRLGYKHKGSEKLFEVLPLKDKIRLSERISGDTSFSHSLAFCQAIESLSDVKILDRVKYLRVIFSELERLANHFGDIGMIMNDTGYSFGGSSGLRIREIIMQWNEKLTGSRFLRGVNMIGGTNKDISEEFKKQLIEALENIKKDFSEIIEIAENSSSVLNRLKSTGTLNKHIAEDHGVIGYVGRASGIATDARIDYAYGAYEKLDVKIAVEEGGDVYARYRVRVREVYESIRIINKALSDMPMEEILFVDVDKLVLKKSALSIGITEGWRGDIVYFVATDKDGNIYRVDVRDPSFLNWPVIGYAARGNIVPDFPLINKSFNLSYSGYDL